MRVFMAVASLRPSYGGPARSVPRLADALAEAGHEVALWAADGTAPGTEFLRSDSGVDRRDGTLRGAIEAGGAIEVFHDNGIWLPHNHGLSEESRRRGLPRVVSLRGMLDPWCRNSKRWKKNVAWRLYQRRDLEAAAVLHATADAEADNIRSEGVRVPIAVIPNGMDLPRMPDGEGGEKAGKLETGTREALFVGRIYRVKGLPMLIEAWRRVRPKGWRLRIVGPDFEGHQEEVERCIREAGLEQEIHLEGPRDGEAKRKAYEAAEVCVLPTYSENFGMAIAEALAHGVPVLTTKGAPWPMLQERGCGWWVEPEPGAIAGALRQATETSPQRLREMGQRGRALVEERFQWGAVAEQMTRLYGWIRTGGTAPEFVRRVAGS